jgi:hypothetical protein
MLYIIANGAGETRTEPQPQLTDLELRQLVRTCPAPDEDGMRKPEQQSRQTRQVSDEWCRRTWGRNTERTKQATQTKTCGCRTKFTQTNASIMNQPCRRKHHRTWYSLKRTSFSSSKDFFIVTPKPPPKQATQQPQDRYAPKFNADTTWSPTTSQ